MKKRTKQNLIRRVSSSVCAVIVAVTTIFSGVSFASASSSKSTSDRKIDVWDFGGVLESDTDTYENMITTSFWDNYDNLLSSGKFNVAGSCSWGDLTLYFNNNDRIYYSGSKNFGSSALATTAYSDGYTANGMYYANGTGSDSRRYIEIDNVQAGDKIVVYMASSSSADSIIYFQYEGSDGIQCDTDDFTNVSTKYEFIAQYDGTYKIYTDSSAGKPIYNRVARIPGVAVTGELDLDGIDISDYTLQFTCDSTGVTTTATLNADGTFNITLAADETYSVSLSGAIGYGITNDTKKFTTTVADSLVGILDAYVKVEAKETYTYSGKITGFDSDYDTSNLSIVMEADENSLVDDVVLDIDSEGNFRAILEPSVNYSAKLYGVNDYEIVSGGTVNDSSNVNEDIEVAAKTVYKVTGEFTGNEGILPTSLVFKNVDDSYEYTGTITSTGYEVELRAGSYSIEAKIEGYRTTTHIVVSKGDVSKDIMFVTTSEASALELQSDIYVGYEDKGELNYNTVTEAISAAARMNPTSEDERITIHIAPGTYREQVIISTPYISFVNDTDDEVLLTWYYGIGYQYYSVDSTGYYNAENAYDQYSKNTPSKWGASVYVTGKGTGFRASGITFEASFNRYITEEEIADGVELNMKESIRFERKYGADVTSKSATERACAFAVEATNVELVNCSFLGSQDTLYTGNSSSCLYFLNCHIEGNTDYIFGDGNAVFDKCELCFYGYSTGSVGGYITAMKPSGTAGYLFRNCTITANDELTVTAGYLGRPWGATANVTFLNTKIDGDLILDAGYTSMSGNLPENANYREYNTVYMDGTSVDLSKRVTGVIDEETANSITIADYFGTWVPESLIDDSELVDDSNDSTGTGDIEINDDSQESSDSSKEEEIDTSIHTLWVVGDSTVSAFNDAYYYPRYGYGTQLYKYLTDNITVQNLALSGRSSKSYTQDAEYQTLINGMQEGDYLIIGFGHNDEKAEADRYTNPNGDYTTEGSFANSLYENYIKIAQEKGVTVILATPVVRRTATGTWSASNLHVTSTSGDYEGGDYAQAIRDLGEALGITVVDMTTLTKNLYDELGADETLYLHAWTSSSASSVDNTHANIYGATYWAYLMTKAIKETDNSLAKYIITAEAPTKEATLVVNSDYKEADYTPIADGTVSELWKSVGIWSGSVFGNVGGSDKITTSNFVLEEADGGLRIAVLNGNGKIASTVDGIAMYYYKIPVGSTFTLTATATVNSITQNDQVSFGLMARDDMYLDTSLTETLGDYVVAGPLKLTKTGYIWNCFARKSGTLTQGGTCSTYQSINAGDTFELKIESNSDGYACTFGEESTITGGFDFALTSNDSEYVYVGMFVSRQADVTFTNIKLVVDGVEVAVTEVDSDNTDNTENGKDQSIDDSDGTTLDDPTQQTFEDGIDTNNEGEVALDEGKIYTMLEGGAQSVWAGVAQELTFRSEADFSLFKGVSVDGVIIDASNYIAKSGSTIVTLLSDYVATLSAGEHKISILSEDGAAVATVTVENEVVEAGEVAADTENVVAVVSDSVVENTTSMASTDTSSEVASDETKTGDINNMMLYVVLTILAGMGAVLVFKKRYVK